MGVELRSANLRVCAFFFGVALVLLWRLLGGDVQAEHRHDVKHRHIDDINSPSDEVDACVRVLDGSTVGFAEARDFIAATLDNSTNGWNGVGNIETYTFISECQGFPSWETRELYDLAIYVDDDIDYPAACGTFPGAAGCVTEFGGEYFDPDAFHPESEYRWAWIYVKSEHIENQWEGLINHEVGHAFGLCDGGDGTLPTPTPNACNLNLGPRADECTGSVMHSYGCSHGDYPSEQDKNSVLAQMPFGGGAGYAISCGRGFGWSNC